MDFRTCILMEKDNNRLREVETAINPYLDLARQIHAFEQEPVLFKNWNEFQVAANIFCNRDSYAKYLQIPIDHFLEHLSHRFKNEPAAMKTENRYYGEVEITPVDLSRLPILTHYNGDGGPYITAGVWIVNDPEYGRNLSYHRMMIINKRQGAVRVVENRGMHHALSQQQENAEVAICIGASPAVLLAAACSPAKDVDELQLAARLDQITLLKCKTVDLQVPADCEIVLEGHFTNRSAAEGPFVDITGTWDKVRQQPIVEITRIAHRQHPIYHALLPGKAEHRMLMGMPKEIDIYNQVSQICPCLDVRVTEGGCAWLHAVLKIRKENADDGRYALEAAFDAHRSLKHCVVVDEDINIDDMSQVEWAIATRFQADRDLWVQSDQPSSSLDPSAVHIEGQKSRGSKMGLDATIKKGADAQLFQKVQFADK